MRWTLSGLFVVAGLLCRPGLASANTFYADLDRDGRPDIVTIETMPKPGLRVWLSGSNRSLLLTTRRPITHVTASDLDGDGHVELVAADASARVHVWHRTHRGRLRPTRPREPPRNSGISRSPALNTAPADLPITVLDERSSAPVDATHPVRATSLDVRGQALTASQSAADTDHVRPTQPRAPPLG